MDPLHDDRPLRTPLPVGTVRPGRKKVRRARPSGGGGGGGGGRALPLLWVGFV